MTKRVLIIGFSLLLTCGLIFLWLYGDLLEALPRLHNDILMPMTLTNEPDQTSSDNKSASPESSEKPQGKSFHQKLDSQKTLRRNRQLDSAPNSASRIPDNDQDMANFKGIIASLSELERPASSDLYERFESLFLDNIQHDDTKLSEVLNYLVEQLGSSEADVLIPLVGRASNPQVESFAIKQVEVGAGDEAVLGLELLTRVGTGSDEHLETVLSVLENSGDKEVLRQGFYALPQREIVGRDRERLVQVSANYAMDRDVRLRRRAVETLGRWVQDHQRFLLVLENLDADWAIVRLAAVNGVLGHGEWLDSEAIEKLFRIAETDPARFVRQQASKALEGLALTPTQREKLESIQNR
ncbi:HEAT repeat domain-containing protein [Pseudobacteriovorax antillogorgiicola]|uniref:HEAT repeat-containing protein n=1 Tax=Pseudobacteriovorax antillogorgiicola TaxID=1513793 RepID=A0A1Y6CGV0_9BACT|nr:HEAT repeat domain-containing protein [Pseudobacteriovorax antillogorgiicola]TCS46961.1 hypothetical protein EDD56_12256 [Pseudobacteriovorax antillogorgiicola]SMF64561.1 hypothetical protein SAMN06296036_12256 [Pseudobacteriovorax antillogorgiicola]